MSKKGYANAWSFVIIKKETKGNLNQKNTKKGINENVKSTIAICKI